MLPTFSARTTQDESPVKRKVFAGTVDTNLCRGRGREFESLLEDFASIRCGCFHTSDSQSLQLVSLFERPEPFEA